MRVLHLYAGNLYGGVEAMLSTLARYRHMCPGMEPEFGLCFRGRLWDELTATGVSVYDLGAVRLSRLWTVWAARRRLRRVLDTGRFDVVIGHCCWPVAVFGPTVRLAGRPLVYWSHDAGLTAHEPGSRPTVVERWAMGNRPSLTVAISDYTRPFAEAYFPGTRVERFYPPIPMVSSVNDRAAVRAEWGATNGQVVIAQTSRLVPYKGQQLLVAALARLRAVPRWVCWVAGGVRTPAEGRHLAELREAVRSAGIEDRVRFLGEQADIPRLLSGADIHCQPNTRPELFGIAFVEAMATGLPVVTTAIGAAPEVVGGCGRLVPPNDPVALSAVLSELVQDPVARAKAAADGPARAAFLCDPARQMARLGGILSGLLPANRGTL